MHSCSLEYYTIGAGGNSPGEIRHLLVALRPTGSLEVQVLLVAGDQRTPRSGVVVDLYDGEGRKTAHAVTDFDGYVLFDGLGFGKWQAGAAGQDAPSIDLSRDRPDQAVRLLIPARNQHR